MEAPTPSTPTTPPPRKRVHWAAGVTTYYISPHHRGGSAVTEGMAAVRMDESSGKVRVVEPYPKRLKFDTEAILENKNR